jgi:hypothetical protein
MNRGLCESGRGSEPLRAVPISLGPEHPDIGMRLNRLADLLMDTNRLDETDHFFAAYWPSGQGLARIEARSGASCWRVGKVALGWRPWLRGSGRNNFKHDLHLWRSKGASAIEQAHDPAPCRALKGRIARGSDGEFQTGGF